MNAQQFFNIVAQMRDAQNKYFRTRSKTALDEARNLERKIDVEIARVKAAKPAPPTEGDLFDGANGND